MPPPLTDEELEELRIKAEKWRQYLSEKITSGPSKEFLADYGRGYRYSDVLDSQLAETHFMEYGRLRRILRDRGISGEDATELDMIAKILHLARSEISIVNLFVSAKIHLRQLNRLLSFLTDSGLLIKKDDRYSITKRGADFLFHWQRALVLLNGGKALR